MQALVTKVDTVRDYGNTLTIVTVGDHEVVANKHEDGTPRWKAGEPVIYVPEGAIIPEDVLKERGYWDFEKDRGLLEGGKRNRIKMRKMAGFESRGLLFKLDYHPEFGHHVTRREGRDLTRFPAKDGDDVAEFLGITEYTA